MNLSIYKNLEEILIKAKEILGNEKFDELKGLLEQKSGETRIKVLLYGPYNSGKTTLINALAGEELFKVGPIPETMELQPVVFGGYEIVDSPGFNAPTPKAEELSIKCARWDADLVIMVSSISYLQDERLWKECEELLSRGKDVFIVGNIKEEINEKEIEDVRNNVAAKILRIQTKIKENPGKIYGPYFVNALSAFNARTSRPKKEYLEIKSNIHGLQTEIQHYVMRNKDLSGAGTVAINIMLSLEDKKQKIIGEFNKNDEKELAIKSAIEKIEKVKKDFEEFVNREERSSLNSLESLASKIVWGEIGSGEKIFYDEILKEGKSLEEKSKGFLKHLLQSIRYELREAGIDPLSVIQEHEKELQELFPTKDTSQEIWDAQHQEVPLQTGIEVHPPIEGISKSEDLVPKISSGSIASTIYTITQAEQEIARNLNNILRTTTSKTAKSIAIQSAKSSGRVLRTVKVAAVVLIAIWTIEEIRRNMRAIKQAEISFLEEVKKEERRIQKQKEFMEHKMKMDAKRVIEVLAKAVKNHCFGILYEIEDRIRDKVSELKNFSQYQQQMVGEISEIESELEEIIGKINQMYNK